MFGTEYRQESDRVFIPDTNYYQITSAPLSPQLTPILKGETTTDVCIVGSGFTGLVTAYFLMKAGLKVTILERHDIGWGASGRNGGQVLSGFFPNIRDIYQRYSAEVAGQLWQLPIQGISIVKQIIADNALSCDWQTGSTTTVETPAEQRDLLHYAEFLESKFGTKRDLWDAATCATNIGTKRYCQGLHDANAGHFHPLKYCRALAKVLVKNGVTIHTYTPAQSVERHATHFHIRAPQGTIKATSVLLAGDSYQGTLIPSLRKKYVLIRNAIIATAPLPDDLNILTSRTALDENTAMLHFYRKTPDNRLLFGGGDSVTPARTSILTQQKNIAVLKTNLLKIFPQLKNTAIDYEWGGYIAITDTLMPNVGEHQPGLFYANGYSGHGIAIAHVTAKLLADAISKNDQAYKVFGHIKNLTFPGHGRWDYYLATIGMWRHQIQHMFQHH